MKKLCFDLQIYANMLLHNVELFLTLSFLKHLRQQKVFVVILKEIAWQFLIENFSSKETWKDSEREKIMKIRLQKYSLTNHAIVV